MGFVNESVVLTFWVNVDEKFNSIDAVEPGFTTTTFGTVTGSEPEPPMIPPSIWKTSWETVRPLALE